MSEATIKLREHIGRLMHESWSKTKRAQGFHGPHDRCTGAAPSSCNNGVERCEKFHADLIPWEQLPAKQQDINRHAFDAVLQEYDLQPKLNVKSILRERVAEIQRQAQPFSDESALPILYGGMLEMLGEIACQLAEANARARA